MPRGKKVTYKKFDRECEAPSECAAPVMEESKVVSVFSTTREAEANSTANILKEIHNKGYIPHVRNRVFYLIHVNWFCVTHDDVFYPAELGLVEFSLETGITSTYHKIINSGPIPLGYAFEVKKHVEETHRLPTETGEGNYRWILDAIRRTLTKGENCKELPPLYTMPDHTSNYFSLSAVKSTLLTLCEGAGCPEEYDSFRVFSLRELFFEMKNVISWQIHSRYAFSKLLSAEAELQKVTYTHSEWISCNSSLRPKKPSSREHMRRTKSKKCNDVAELQSSLPVRLEQLAITKDSQCSNMKEIFFKTEGGSDLNKKANKKKTMADVVSGIGDSPQFSECNFPAIGNFSAIGSGKKSNRYTKP